MIDINCLNKGDTVYHSTSIRGKSMLGIEELKFIKKNNFYVDFEDVLGETVSFCNDSEEIFYTFASKKDALEYIISYIQDEMTLLAGFLHNFRETLSEEF